MQWLSRWLKLNAAKAWSLWIALRDGNLQRSALNSPSAAWLRRFYADGSTELQVLSADELRWPLRFDDIAAASRAPALHSVELRYPTADGAHYRVRLHAHEAFAPADDDDVDFAPSLRIVHAELRFAHRSPFDCTRTVQEFAGPSARFSDPVEPAEMLWAVFDVLAEAEHLCVLDSRGRQHTLSIYETLHNAL